MRPSTVHWLPFIVLLAKHQSYGFITKPQSVRVFVRSCQKSMVACKFPYSAFSASHRWLICHLLSVGTCCIDQAQVCEQISKFPFQFHVNFSNHINLHEGTWHINGGDIPPFMCIQSGWFKKWLYCNSWRACVFFLHIQSLFATICTPPPFDLAHVVFLQNIR